MQRYHSIRLGSTWLTEDASSTGTPYITEITGLDNLSLKRQSNVFIAIDGTPIKQFNDNKGLPVAIKFDGLTDADFTATVSAYNTADDANTSVRLYITGPTGVYDLSVVPKDISFPASALSATIRTVTLNFVVSAVHYTLTASPGSITLTGRSVTLTHA